MEEKALIEALRQGSESALQDLMKHYRQRLLAIAWGVTLDHEESLEIVQDVFLSAHRNIHTFRGDAGLATWLRKITINKSLNWKRRWKRRFRRHHTAPAPGEEVVAAPDAHSRTPESDYLYRETEQNIAAQVALLPEKIRTVFVLKTLEEMSYADIARLLNITTGTVASRLYHARKRLAAALKGSHP